MDSTVTRRVMRWGVLPLATVAGVATTAPAASASSRGDQVVQYAGQQQGKPYKYGAEGPNSFDCSGLTKYVYAHFGVRLPHNADAQYHHTYYVSRSAIQPGDLVFVPGNGGMQHVGIYSGNGRWWSADHSGTSVRNEPIWASNWVGGRP